jgi:hypothetical protein
MTFWDSDFTEDARAESVDCDVSFNCLNLRIDPG